VWFGTVHLDRAVKTKLGTLLSLETMAPAIDEARETFKADLSKTTDVESTKEFQMERPTLGGNQRGTQFFTDGKAYIFSLESGPVGDKASRLLGSVI
jgi:hypothetical protein